MSDEERDAAATAAQAELATRAVGGQDVEALEVRPSTGTEAKAATAEVSSSQDGLSDEERTTAATAAQAELATRGGKNIGRVEVMPPAAPSGDGKAAGAQASTSTDQLGGEVAVPLFVYRVHRF